MTRAWLVLAGLCSACAAGGEPSHTQLDVDAPASWSAAATAEGALSQTWWRDLGDPRLEPLLEEALRGNLDLQAAAARVRLAAAQAEIAGADLLPQLGAGFDARRARQNFIGLPIPGSGSVLSTTSTSFGLNLALSWEVDLWGRLSALERAAVADLEATAADASGARLSLSGQVAKIWFALAEARAQLRLAEQTAASYGRTAQRLEARYREGMQPAAAVRLARTQAANAASAVALWGARADALTRQLEVLLGRYPSGQLEGGDALPAVVQPVPAGIPARLVARRPDLFSAERRLRAADARFDAAEASLYPSIALTASGGTSSDALGDLLDGDFLVWSLLGSLAAPLFQGGRLRAGVDLAAAGVDQTLAAYAQSVLRAYAEVESALAAEGFLARREAELDHAAAEASAAEALSRRRFLTGLSNVLVLLESQRAAWQARSALLDVRRQRLETRVDLYLALGGGFTAEQASPDEHPPLP